MWRDLCGGFVEKLVLAVGGFLGQSEDSCFTAQHWWCNVGKNRELVDRSGVQATGDCLLGSVEHHVQLLDVGAPAPD